MKEPLRCNKCHLYGHIRAKCPNSEKCVRCGSLDHTGKDCQKPPRCLTCVDVPGQSAAHTNDARERICESFRERAETLSARTPESQLPYFPILGDEITWESNLRSSAGTSPRRFGNLHSMMELSQNTEAELGQGANSTPLGLWRFSQPESLNHD
jgi:hypothetical protein